jgi:heme-degrading monooxygenase HmoA
MAVLMMLEVPGGTVEQYERVNEILGVDSDSAPEGLLYHVAGASEDGLVVADVWRSEEDLERFFEAADPAIKEAGMQDAVPRIAPVHNHIPSRDAAPGVLAIIELENFTPADYDQMTSQMDGHTSVADHPSVAHIAAVTEDGGFLVVDVWESPEAFAAFAESQIAPAGEQVGLGPVEPRFVPVHNTITGATAPTR